MIVDIKWRIVAKDLKEYGELYVELFYVIDGEEKVWEELLYNSEDKERTCNYDIDGFKYKEEFCPEYFFDYFILINWDEIITEAKKILIKEML